MLAAIFRRSCWANENHAMSQLLRLGGIFGGGGRRQLDRGRHDCEGKGDHHDDRCPFGQSALLASFNLGSFGEVSAVRTSAPIQPAQGLDLDQLCTVRVDS